MGLKCPPNLRFSSPDGEKRLALLDIHVPIWQSCQTSPYPRISISGFGETPHARKRQRAKFSSGKLPLQKGGVVQVDYSATHGVRDDEEWLGVVNYIERAWSNNNSLVHVTLFAQHGIDWWHSIVTVYCYGVSPKQSISIGGIV